VLVAVIVPRARNDLAVGEIAGGLLDQPLFVCEFEVDHVPVILQDERAHG
jgi:hypothetical protein